MKLFLTKASFCFVMHALRDFAAGWGDYLLTIQSINPASLLYPKYCRRHIRFHPFRFSPLIHIMFEFCVQLTNIGIQIF